METYKVVNKKNNELQVIYNNVTGFRSYHDESGKLLGELTLEEESTATFNRLDWAIYKLDWVFA